MRDSLWLVIAVLLLAIALGAWLSRYVQRWLLRRRLARQWQRARQGEVEARSWLEREGFTILDEQSHRASLLVVDGDEVPFTVRADYVVQRNGVRAVVEVKTGAVASPSSRATRRQVLEYAWVYDVDEVYLFDADTPRLHRIGVPSRPRAPLTWRALMRPVGLALLIGAVLGALIVWRFLK